jgi:hypothetical protein
LSGTAMMSFIHTNYAILTLWLMSPKHHLLDLWSCEIAMAFAVVAACAASVAGAERSSAVLMPDNWPNAELALCAGRRLMYRPPVNLERAELDAATRGCIRRH